MGRISQKNINAWIEATLSILSWKKEEFQKLLFQRVMPNLRRIGLLRDSVKKKFDDLGILEFASSKSDADIDWADLSRPLFEDSA